MSDKRLMTERDQAEAFMMSLHRKVVSGQARVLALSELGRRHKQELISITHEIRDGLLEEDLPKMSARAAALTPSEVHHLLERKQLRAGYRRRMGFLKATLEEVPDGE